MTPIFPQMEYCLGGGDGLISVTADVAPREMAEVVKACRAGDRQAAEAINNKVRSTALEMGSVGTTVY